MGNEPQGDWDAPQSSSWLDDLFGSDFFEALLPDLLGYFGIGYAAASSWQRSALGEPDFNRWRLRMAVLGTRVLFAVALCWFIFVAIGELWAWQHLGHLPYGSVDALLTVVLLGFLLKQLRRPQTQGWSEIPEESHFLARVFVVWAIAVVAGSAGIAELVLDAVSGGKTGHAKSHLFANVPYSWSFSAIVFMVLLVAYGCYCLRFVMKKTFVYHSYIRILEVKRFEVLPQEFLMRYAGLYFFSFVVPDWIPGFSARGDGYAGSVRHLGDQVGGYFGILMFAILLVGCFAEIGEFVAVFQHSQSMDAGVAVGAEVPEQA